ncbi:MULTISPECIES: NAD-dependent epimerase/dehydratase family protein [Bacillaceae]|uniref:NAD-dependent epimerase/dehydratase domain-containing protein n=1 Tax=Alkalicoccobacillus plakortidis TaxID=444060 RepID=A0A9D5DTN8_9BACI|nr:MULTISPECIES: NAD(P)-dependent oxidoreductase [Bacillaceae]KQL56486.1 hypothetical protein AN965_13590 [Alkalicoccobacillus plakortidis]
MNIAQKRVLLSGSGGLLGSEIINQLKNNDSYNVIAITSQSKQLQAKYKEFENLTVVDITEWFGRKDIEADVLIHSGFPRSSNPTSLSAGLISTEKIIKKSIDSGVSSVINISSQSVYSQSEKDNTTEQIDVSPESNYGMTKFAVERIVNAFCKERVHFTNIRLASLVALNFDIRLTNKFVKDAFLGKALNLTGGDQKISYLDVRDAASGIINMLEFNSSKWKEVYNLGNDDYLTLVQIAEHIRKLLKESHNIDVVINIKENSGPNTNNLIDSNLFYKDFNWKPDFTMKHFIKDLIHNYN